MIADALLVDDHHLVLKGYGWMLKVLSVVDPSMVKDYLIKKPCENAKSFISLCL